MMYSLVDVGGDMNVERGTNCSFIGNFTFVASPSGILSSPPALLPLPLVLLPTSFSLLLIVCFLGRDGLAAASFFALPSESDDEYAFNLLFGTYVSLYAWIQ